MSPSSAAQDEFNALFNGSGNSPSQPHPEDQNYDRENSPNPAGSPSNLRSSNNRAQGDSSDSDNPGSNNNGKMRSRYFIPTNKSQANTGPKGVIADAQAFQQAKRIHMSTLKLGASSTNIPAQQAAVREQAMAEIKWEEELDPGSDEDDEFMDRWRQSRLRELTSVKGRVAGRSGSRPQNGPGRYGTLTHVDAVGYLDAVEKTAGDTVVLVFIFDDMVSFYLVKPWIEC
jgi:hypothetical protein